MSALGRDVGGGWGKRKSWEGGLQSGGTPGPSGVRVASARSHLLLGAWWAERLPMGGAGGHAGASHRGGGGLGQPLWHSAAGGGRVLGDPWGQSTETSG